MYTRALELDPLRFRQDQDSGAVSGGAKSAVYLPIDHRGRAVGALIFSSPKPDGFGPNDLPIAQLIRLQVAAAVRNTQLVESLETAEAVATTSWPLMEK